MAPEELDKVWIEVAAPLSASYEKTLALLDGGKTPEADKEFHRNFAGCVKRLYADAAKTSPKRFEKVKDWPKWIKSLYDLTRSTEKALDKGKKDEAQDSLLAIREAFAQMHAGAGCEGANDYIHALRKLVAKSDPPVKQLRELTEALGLANPPLRTRAEPAACVEARSQWSAEVGKALKDENLQPGEKVSLRKTAESLYRQYGLALE